MPDSPSEHRTSVPATPAAAAPAWAGLGPREILTIFTAGWLGGAGAIMALDGGEPWPGRVLGLAEAVAAALWFLPRYRLAGFGAMLAVLIIAAVRVVLTGHLPGALIFYAAVVVYLAVEGGALDRDAGTGVTPPRG